MQREFIIPGSHNDVFTRLGDEPSAATLEQAQLALRVCLDSIKATCTKKNQCGAFPNTTVTGDGVEVAFLSASDVRCRTIDCPEAFKNLTDTSRM